MKKYAFVLTLFVVFGFAFGSFEEPPSQGGVTRLYGWFRSSVFALAFGPFASLTQV
jgi:hypothetical protein